MRTKLSTVPGGARCWSFLLPTTMTVRSPAALATENTVGTVMYPCSGLKSFQSQVILWTFGSSPDSIEAWPGSVSDGATVRADQV